MKTEVIQEFRRHLRIIERDVAEQLKGQTQCCGVTLAQCHTLIELGDAGTINLGGLAERLGQDASTLSRTVESLVQAGLLERALDPANRRAVILSLTPQGTARLGAINEACNAFYGRLLRSVPSRKVPVLMEGVRLVAGVMAAERQAAQEKSCRDRSHEDTHE